MDGARIADGAFAIRRDLLTLLPKEEGGRAALALASADLFAVLYWDVMRFSLPRGGEDDRLVVDSLDFTAAHHAALANRGFFPRGHLWQWGRLGSLLQQVGDDRRAPGVDCSQPASGAGLALALGMASGGGRVFCLMDEMTARSPRFFQTLPFWRDQCADANLTLAILLTEEAGRQSLLTHCQALGLPVAFADGRDAEVMARVLRRPGVALLLAPRACGVPSWQRLDPLPDLTRDVREQALEELRRFYGRKEEGEWTLNCSLFSGEI